MWWKETYNRVFIIWEVFLCSWSCTTLTSSWTSWSLISSTSLGAYLTICETMSTCSKEEKHTGSVACTLFLGASHQTSISMLDFFLCTCWTTLSQKMLQLSSPSTWSFQPLPSWNSILSLFRYLLEVFSLFARSRRKQSYASLCVILMWNAP